jgi:hypothetical protein
MEMKTEMPTLESLAFLCPLIVRARKALGVLDSLPRAPKPIVGAEGGLQRE